MATLFGSLVDSMVYEPQIHRLTKYVSPTMTVKVTRQGRPKKSDRAHTLVFTLGRANYRERLFIKACLKAGEPFPVRKVHVAFYPRVKR